MKSIKRRKFLSQIGLCSLFLSAGSMYRCTRSDRQLPNILFILTDDQGYGDLRCHGNTEIQTPNLDKLHSESVRLTNFHSGTTCAPTRAGLMSGMDCNRAGAWHTVMGRSFLSTRYETLPDLLKKNGYRTGIFGKWHLGDNYPYRPRDRGFDDVLTHGGGGIGQTPDYWNNDYFNDFYFRNGNPEKFTGYCTDIWFNEAFEFMHKASSAERPFFCFLSANAPHGPHHVPQKYIDLYKDNPNVPHPNFYGQITNFDENLGLLEQGLERLGIKENTILIFMTDNGTSMGADLDDEKYVIRGYNAGMRGKKGSEYEGGHRVPLFIRFPESIRIQKGELNALTNYTDFMPTLLDLVDIRSTDNFDGTSLMPLLRTGNQPELNDRILVVDTQRIEFPQKWKNTCVMQNQWRLINNQELYHLEQDPEQRDNVIEQYPVIAKKLENAYEKHWANLKPDLEQINRIVVGSEYENPALLTCHDWHSEQLPPWHQNHIREGKVNNGYWLLDVQRAGEYVIRLYRWPPYLQKKLSDTMKMGDKVPGGVPFKQGLSLNLSSAKVHIQDKIYNQKSSVLAKYFEFNVSLKKGPAALQTWLLDGLKRDRGAYYVEIEFAA